MNAHWLTVLLALAALLQPPPAAPPAPPAPPAPVQPTAEPATAAPATIPATTPARREEKWWTDRHEAFNARARQGAEKGDIGVIFLGDSITQGWESAGREIWAERFAPMNAVNLGIGGDRTQHVLWRLDHGNLDGLAKPQKGTPPKAVVLMIGTNNSGTDPADQIAAGISAIVAKLRQKLPEGRILLLAVFPRSRNPDALREKLAEVNRLIRPLADGRTVRFLDIGDRFVEKDGTISPEVMPDSLHLSTHGYRLWADAIEPTLKELVGP